MMTEDLLEGYPYPVYNIRLNWWPTFVDIYVAKLPNEETRVMRLYPQLGNTWRGVVYENKFFKHLKDENNLNVINSLDDAINLCADMYNKADAEKIEETL